VTALTRLRTYLRYRGNRPVTDSNRLMRDRRALVVQSMDASSLAYALGPYDAELGSLQRLADRGRAQRVQGRAVNAALGVLNVAVIVVALGAARFGGRIRRHWRTYPAAAPPVVVPVVLDPFQAMVEAAWLEAVEQAQALAEVGQGWRMPSRAQVEQDLIERGLRDLNAWANERSSRSDGAP
jgi:hypothetical protein